jgi:arachidonate 15-lipoxygenase
MSYSLPQNDPKLTQKQRAAELEKIRSDYDYNHDALSEMLKQDSPSLKYPMAASVPFDENSLTKLEWTRDVVATLLRIQSNQAMYDVTIEGNSVIKLLWYIRLSRILKENSGWVGSLYKALLWIFQNVVSLFKPTKSENIEADIEKGTSKSIDKVEERVKAMVSDVQRQSFNKKNPPKDSEFTALTSSLSLTSYQDLFQIIHLPSISDRVQDDRLFAAQRVAGVNPLVIQRLTAFLDHFPVTNQQYQSVMGTDDSLQQALDDQRLYITDYQVLEQLEMRQTQGTEARKYLAHPIALFAMPSGTCPNRALVPVAIQCQQTPSSENPIFTPPGVNGAVSKYWAWQMAKLTVQIADANYHELISHLGRTHLWIEPIAMATARQLSPRHPLGALLRTHLEGTLFINDAAVKGLINPGGTIDKLVPGTLESSLLLSLKGAKGYPFAFNESFLPMTLKSFGVDDRDALPDYPYRDDALLIWNAIQDWVSQYLGVFYTTDQAVEQDTELQEWITELLSPAGGQMSGIGEVNAAGKLGIWTLRYLIDAVTLIIFTCSAQHAAVNFPQSSLMTYMPNMPLGGYAASPTSSETANRSDYFEMLPSIAQSESQLNSTYLLGSIYYTVLGEYKDEGFRDPLIKDILQDFQENLRSIEQEIQARNQIRPTYYDVLRPSKIPQSTNI